MVQKVIDIIKVMHMREKKYLETHGVWVLGGRAPEFYHCSFDAVFSNPKTTHTVHHGFIVIYFGSARQFNVKDNDVTDENTNSVRSHMK